MALSLSCRSRATSGLGGFNVVQVITFYEELFLARRFNAVILNTISEAAVAGDEAVSAPEVTDAQVAQVQCSYRTILSVPDIMSAISPEMSGLPRSLGAYGARRQTRKLRAY